MSNDLSDEDMDKLTPGGSPKPNRAAASADWNDVFYDSIRKRIAKEPLDAIRLVQEVIRELSNGIELKRFSSHANAFESVVEAGLSEYQRLAQAGYFEVVQGLAAHIGAAKKISELWGGEKLITRNSIEDFALEPIDPAGEYWLGPNKPEAVHWTDEVLGDVWSVVSCSGSDENIARVRALMPADVEEPGKRFTGDISIHRYLAYRYFGVKTKGRNPGRGKTAGLIPEPIGKLSWRIMLETKRERLTAFLPDGHSRVVLVKRFVVMLVHGLFWNNGIKQAFEWKEFPPKCDDTKWDPFPPYVVPRADSVQLWVKRIRVFLRSKVNGPEELSIFKSMVRINEALYLKGGDDVNFRLPLSEDKLGYRWNPVDKAIREALKWYFGVLRSLPNQKVLSFD